AQSWSNACESTGGGEKVEGEMVEGEMVEAGIGGVAEPVPCSAALPFVHVFAVSGVPGHPGLPGGPISVLPSGVLPWAWVQYAGAPLWHQRKVLGRLRPSAARPTEPLRLIIATPQSDVYDEDYAGTSADIQGVRMAAARAIPPGLDRGQTHRFHRDPTAAELVAFNVAAEQVCQDILANEAMLAGVPFVPNPQGCLQPLCRSSWTAPGPLLARRWLLPLESQRLPSAARPLLCRTRYAEAVRDMTESVVSNWPTPGPRSVHWCVVWLERRSSTPLSHHRWFTSTFNLKSDQWGVEQHGTALRALEELICFDGTDASNLAGVEVIMRKAQLTEYVYWMDSLGNAEKGKGASKPSVSFSGLMDESAIFSGLNKDTGAAMVCPALLDHVSAEVQKDAAILNQVSQQLSSAPLPVHPCESSVGGTSLGWQFSADSAEVRAFRSFGRRHLHLGDSMAPILATGASFLEHNVIKPQQRMRYITMVNDFKSWCLVMGIALDTVRQLVVGLAQYFHDLFFNGEVVDRASALLAALAHLESCRLSRKTPELPRARAALRGFGRLAPKRARLPMPWVVAALVIVKMIACGNVGAGWLTLLNFAFYCRPSELLRARRKDLIPPVARGLLRLRHWGILLNLLEGEIPSKTHAYDESLMNDNPDFKWIDTALEHLRLNEQVHGLDQDAQAAVNLCAEHIGSVIPQPRLAQQLLAGADLPWSSSLGSVHVLSLLTFTSHTFSVFAPAAKFVNSATNLALFFKDMISQ
ncbi:unnamed protein product, partial [Prorocentrum cordatum]